ncbi:MAG: hypothetical protein JW737_00140 [Acidobacteria bacterium]|nr:hypothetical protein [Acidobacteriota bacterium]
MKNTALVICLILCSTSFLFAQTAKVAKADPGVMKIKPDITITALEVLPVRASTSGMRALPKISCKWKRTGSAPAAKWAIKIFTGGKMVGGAWIEPTAGTTGELEVPYNFTIGEHQILCEVDAENNVVETKENNNKWLIIHTVKPPTKPDIIVKKVYLEPLLGSSIRAGKTVNLKCDWERTGPAPTHSFIVKKFIDSTFIGGDTYTPDKKIGTSTSTWTAEFGNKELYCYVDAEDDVVEESEKNNKMISYFMVPPALIAVPQGVTPN